MGRPQVSCRYVWACQFLIPQFKPLIHYIGLNSKRHNITIKTLYRWLDTIDDRGDERPIKLWKIDLRRTGVLAYSVTRPGEPLSRTSTDPILPGDYASYAGEYLWCNIFRFSKPFSCWALDNDAPGDEPVGRLVPPVTYANFLKRKKQLTDAIRNFPQDKVILEKTAQHVSLLSSLTL
jgi:hypothetical protein